MLNIEPHIFNGPAGLKLQSTAKRYSSPSGAAEDGLTLIFAHCLGGHKEQWEPTIERLFWLHRHKPRRERIKEAWAFDWQSHGESAVVNEHLLESRAPAVSPLEWASAIESFIRNNLQGHRIVLIGHSAGCGVILTVIKNFSIRESQFVAIFLVEPMIISRELFDVNAKRRRDSAQRSMELTLERRSSWPDKATAASYLRKRYPWKSWDSRVFDCYIKHGIRTVDSPHGRMASVKTSKRHEGLAYVEFGPYIDATIYYRERCDSIPFHLVFGAKIDFLPRYMQDALCDVQKGYRPTSITRIPDAGHLVVQERPDDVAVAISDHLCSRECQVFSRL